MPASASAVQGVMDIAELKLLVQALGAEEVFGNCTIAELRSHGKRLGLKAVGNKLNIIDSLAGRLSDSEATFGSPVMLSTSSDDGRATGISTLRPMVQALDPEAVLADEATNPEIAASVSAATAKHLKKHLKVRAPRKAGRPKQAAPTQRKREQPEPPKPIASVDGYVNTLDIASRSACGASDKLGDPTSDLQVPGAPGACRSDSPVRLPTPSEVVCPRLVPSEAVAAATVACAASLHVVAHTWEHVPEELAAPVASASPSVSASPSDDGGGLDIAELWPMVRALGPEEVFGNCKVAELRRYCRRFGMKPGGCKVDLIASLGKYLQKASFADSSGSCAGSSKGGSFSEGVSVDDISGACDSDRVVHNHDRFAEPDIVALAAREAEAAQGRKRKVTTLSANYTPGSPSDLKLAVLSEDRSGHVACETTESPPVWKRKITELSDDCMGRAEEADAVWLAPSCLQTGEANETLKPEPKTDEFSSDQQIEVEVRLAFSGVLVTRSKFRVNDSVGDVQRVVAAARAWPPGAQQLLLGTQALNDSSMSLASAGVCDGSELLVTCTGLRWHEKVRGAQADISEDGLTVSRRSGHCKFNNSVVIMNGKMRSFRFQVLDTSARFGGGLEVGFSQIPPEDFRDGLPVSAVGLRHAWICDCYGEMHAYGGSFHCLDVDYGQQAWDPERLKDGDVVVCRATEDGMMQIAVNGRMVANWEANIQPESVGMDLYPVIGLYGKTTSIKLLLQDDAQPRSSRSSFGGA